MGAWCCRAFKCTNSFSSFLEYKYIHSAKPSPTGLASLVIDEDAARNRLREILEVPKGNHTLGGNPKNITR